MNQKRLLCWMLAFLSLIFLVKESYAQDLITVKGTVSEKEQNSSLAGVTVTPVDGKKQGTVTDADGKFEIKVPRNSWLLFEMIGYNPVKIQAKSAKLNITMDVNTKELEEVVVLGYGTQKKELLTGSVATLKMDDTRRNSPTTTLGNLLAGQMAGVRVSTPSGIPGTQPSIAIRTGSSWNSQPVLYVIDGKISGSGDFNNLSPNDIDNISVLKDAASTAVYGSRAAAGVIVVTTRRGKVGKAQISYSFNTGVDKRNPNAARTNAIQSGELFNRANGTNSFWSWTQSDFDYYKGVNNGWGYDQLEAVWQDPSVTTHNISASGGSDKIRYFVGGSYTKQNAFLQNVAYNKYNLRANITADITKDIEVFTGLTLNNNLNSSTTNTAIGDISGIYRKLLVWQPDQPVWTNYGQPVDYGWIGNVGAEVRGDGGYVKSNGIKPVLNMKATYRLPFVQGLSTSVQFNKSYTNDRSKTYGTQYNLYMPSKTGIHIFNLNDPAYASIRKSSQIGKNYIQESYNWSNDYQLNVQANYDRSFGKHSVKGLLGYERFEVVGGGITGGRENFPVYLSDQWGFASNIRADDYASGSTVQPDGRKSYIGQFFYDYDGKYLANFSSRYDGSVKFPADKRWGFFPAGSVGWIVSKENFFKGVKGIDMLKLRASAGVVGNDAIGGWGWQQSYQGGNNIYLGTNPANNVGITYGALTNDQLTWEKTFNTNIGVDVNFLSHFNASAEYYSVKTTNILGQRIATVPPTFSRTLPQSNYGEIAARGLEMNFGYTNKVRNFNYYANLNLSYGGAKYNTLDENPTYPWQKALGMSTSRIVTNEVIGMIRTQADLDALKAAKPNYKYYGIAPALGQLIYEDLSGPNGTPDGTVDNWDQKVVKKNNNPLALGLNLGFDWKGFSLDASFSGNLHQYKYMSDLAGGVEWNRMWANWATDSWTPATPNATLPYRYSANDGTRGVNFNNSTFWLKRADFLRLRLLNVGYTIPQKYTNRVGVSNLKLYFSGSNLFILSNFAKKYYDPEMSDGYSYPNMKTLNFGVNLTL
ncbi:SusC/RagA family TonB-linked outer membrane protein [Solitalea koreensis]|nr:SusC/RagA family TonB-linked outer membrane protein [Solitalea koreensis]